MKKETVLENETYHIVLWKEWYKILLHEKGICVLKFQMIINMIKHVRKHFHKSFINTYRMIENVNVITFSSPLYEEKDYCFSIEEK